MMSRVALAVATGVGALHSTAGASLRSNAGGRSLEGTLYCNSIGCPGGLTPVPNAWEVPCTGSTCTDSECCEAYCSYFACPDGYIAIEDASTTLCAFDVCSAPQCCVSGDTAGESFSFDFVDEDEDDDDADFDLSYMMAVVEDEMYCSSVGCPGGFTPIVDAWETPCTSYPCEVAQCCEAYCSSHPCQGGYTPIPDAATTLCPNDVCTDDACCVATN